MFRKLKKRPLALRSTSSTTTISKNLGDQEDGFGDNEGAAISGGDVDDEDDNNNNSNSKHDNDTDDHDSTSDLLRQLRHERLENNSLNNNNKKKKMKTKKMKKSNDNNNNNNNNWMHQFQSNNDNMTTTALSARDMATRTAEYHPAEKKTSNMVTSTNDNSAQQRNASTLSSHQGPRSKFLAGPIRASTFVRTTVRFDYQPDICKDYKETGFCGFGDTCIYLHDRGETKSGWEMEAEYEENKKRESQKREKEMERFMEGMMCGEIGGDLGGTHQYRNNDDEHAAFNNKSENENKSINIEDGLPYACHICRGPFNNPIITSCQHHFCEGCMLGRIRGEEVEASTTTCPICQKDTNGVLNYPRKLDAKRRRLVGREGTWEEYYELGRSAG